MVQRKKEDDSKNLKSQIKWSVDTLMTLAKDFPKKSSLIDDGENIFLQVALYKIPQVDEMVKRRLSLKHPPYAGKPEVCFIAHDCLRKDGIKRTSDEMIDYTIERFEDYFRKQKVTGITTILPYHQLKTEYDTYELRRKLVNRFDVFLCSSKLNSQNFFFNCLGKPFIHKNKYPISVKLPPMGAQYNPKANRLIQAAIASTVFRIKEGSDNYSIRIGNTLNKKKNIKENLDCVIDKIINSDFIPGGMENIRFIGLKCSKSKIVPLYISMTCGSKVPVPYVEPNVPMKESVEDELSTLPGKKVTVLPSGEVFITPMKDDGHEEVNDVEDEDEEENENFQDDQENEYFYNKAGKKAAGEESKRERGKNKEKRSRKNDSDDEDDEGNEEEIESFEQKYLSNWNEDLESSEEGEDEEVKNQKGKKRKRNASVKMAKKIRKEDTKPPHKVKKGGNVGSKNTKNERLTEQKVKNGIPPVKNVGRGETTPKMSKKYVELLTKKTKRVETKLIEKIGGIQKKTEKGKSKKNPGNKKKIVDVSVGKKKVLQTISEKKMERTKTKVNGIKKNLKKAKLEKKKIKT